MPTKILIIDHNDSFTYNLVQLFEQRDNVELKIINTDNLHTKSVEEFDGIVLSPGPGLPQDYPQVKNLLQSILISKPILGVCLGLQHLTELFGGKLYNQQKVLHGKQITLQLIVPNFLFKNIPDPVKVGLYHSWAADSDTFPDCLQVTSVSENGTIMSFQHKNLPITAVQFHPESYMTEYGNKMIQNWIEQISLTNIIL